MHSRTGEMTTERLEDILDSLRVKSLLKFDFHRLLPFLKGHSDGFDTLESVLVQNKYSVVPK